MADVSQIVLKDANGNVIGTYNVKDTSVPHDSKAAASGGTTLSLVTTGEKATWNAKASTNTTYTFANGTNGFTVTPSGGSAQTVSVTPSITNNITGSGTTNYLAMFTATNTIGPGYNVTESVTSGSRSLVTSGSVYSSALLRNTMVPSSTSWSVDNLKGQTRFVYTSHGTPHSGTTVAFDSSNNVNYTLQLNSNYGGAAANARLSFRTRNGDQSTWSNWLYTCPVYRFNTRIEPNTSVTLYIPLDMRNGTAGDSYFLVLSGNYGSGGLYFLTPNTVSTHQMQITTFKTASTATVAATTDDWGFKITLGQAAYYATLIRLS